MDNLPKLEEQLVRTNNVPRQLKKKNLFYIAESVPVWKVIFPIN